jgi:hypothetical protein
MANYSQKLQSLRLDEEQRVDEFIAALGRGLAALGRTRLGGKVGRGIGALSSEKPKEAYGKVLGKWNPLSGRYEGGSGGTTAERLASWRQANQERKSKSQATPPPLPTTPPPLPNQAQATAPNVTPQQAYDYMKDVGRSMKRTARAETLGNLDLKARSKAAAALKSQRKNNPNASSADVRRAAYSKTGEVLGNQKMKADMKKNLRGAALTSSNKNFDKKVGIPLRKAMEYAHRINSYQGTLMQEMRLSYINLFKNVN